jgi:hypothetical protein
MRKRMGAREEKSESFVVGYYFLNPKEISISEGEGNNFGRNYFLNPKGILKSPREKEMISKEIIS